MNGKIRNTIKRITTVTPDKMRFCIGTEFLKYLGGNTGAKSRPPTAPPRWDQMFTVLKLNKLKKRLMAIRTVKVFPICLSKGCPVKKPIPAIAAKRPKIEVEAPADKEFGEKIKVAAFPKIPERIYIKLKLRLPNTAST